MIPKKLDAFHLKLIAIITMFINHLGHAYKVESMSWQLSFITGFIGKMTFPIMAFLLVEGFNHTRNRFNYLSRFAIFWLLSILPFHWLFAADKPIYFFNNIMFTLALGLLLLIVLEKVQSRLLQYLIITLFALATYNSDWYLFGIVMIAGFWRHKNQPLGFISPIIWMILSYMAYYLYNWWSFGYLPHLAAYLPWYKVFSFTGALLTIPLLASYNGQRGYSPNWIKWGFYLFYPLHLLLLLALTQLT